MRRDLGDFQTPPALVAAVLNVLGPIGTQWPRVLEPTCGRGHFLAGLWERQPPPREIRGIEIQEAHCEAARAAPDPRVEVIRASLFDLDLRRDLRWNERGPLLVVGNPPWVTNAALGVLESGNLPPKSNVKGLRGIDARTGSSNFDIAEAVWLKLLAELSDEASTIALLCKTSVARAVLQFARREALPVAEAAIHKIDATKWFQASVDACLLRVTLGPGARFEHVPVYPGLEATEPASAMGFVRDRLVMDLGSYEANACADGTCPLTWRQGLKHDAAAVMELMIEGESGDLRNKRDETVDVESEFVFPLLKGTDLHRLDGGRPRRAVLVTQTRIGEDTWRLARAAPRLWDYLQAHAEDFDRRKSSIYRGQPPFALFGIGPYSFAPYKVAVSGLHKAPRFRAVGPVGGRPVMFDDTCYFVACESAGQAALVASLLNDPIALDLIRALSFPDSKRPITKAVLQRIDLEAVRDHLDRSTLRARAETLVRHDLDTEITEGEASRVKILKEVDSCLNLGVLRDLGG